MADPARRDPRLLQQFARFPSPGRVKTRLQAALSAPQACRVHESLMRRTARTLAQSRLAPAQLWLDRLGACPLLVELARLGLEGPLLQSGADLGQRMAHALAQGLQRARAVVLVGSDCPGLDRAYLQAAFQALHSADLVFGPAQDGGFVLIGCRRMQPALFRDVPWGTARVLRETLHRARALSLTWTLLPALYDIDRPEDLARWRRECATSRV